MLTINDGEIIAKFINGACHDDFLGIKNHNNTCCQCKQCDDDCLDDPCCEHCKKNSLNLGEEIKIKDNGTLFFTPLTSMRDVVFLSGESGSGKSTTAGRYVDLYHQLYPKNPVIIFSRKTEDPAYGNYIKRVNINALEDKPYDIINMPSFKNGGLVIFDDTNTILDKKIRTSVHNMMHDLLEVGRSRGSGIYMVITNHLINPNNRSDGRLIWTESKNIVIFPATINDYAARYALKNYLGFNEKIIKKILSLPSRWVSIRKTQYGKVILYEKGAFIPNYKK